MFITECFAEDIDVFWLAEKGTPQQLQEAVNQGAKFNVSRSISDFVDENENFNYESATEGWLFVYDETPLHRAATFNRNPESIRFLIAQSADVNAEASQGGRTGYETPLTCAVRKNNIEVIRELLKGGANPNHPTIENIFNIAADAHKNNISEYKAIVDALIEASADVNEHWEVQPDEKKPMLLPKAQWKSSNPMENIRDDISMFDRSNFKASCTALMYAVFDDNPDIVNILLDVSADVSIRNAENKNVWDYAKEMPEDSKLKKSPVFERLKAAVDASKSNNSNNSMYYGIVTAKVLNIRSAIGMKYSEITGQLQKGEGVVIHGSNQDAEGNTWHSITFGFPETWGWISGKHVHLIDYNSDESTKQLEKLVVLNKVPLYVRDKGKFFYNPGFSMVGITGDNVRLRSQPNAKARIIDKISTDNTEKWPAYLGEWTNPGGEHWILADYNRSNKSQAVPVWISGRYANPMDEELYAITLDSMMEARIARERAIIEAVRNTMYYKEYSPELGYEPVGQQLEKFFANGNWHIEDNRAYKNLDKKLAVFKGIARMRGNNRRFMFTVRFGRAIADHIRFRKGSLVLCQIDMNDNTVYRYFMDAGARGYLSKSMQNIVNMAGFFSGIDPNGFSLGDFIELIYSIE